MVLSLKNRFDALRRVIALSKLLLISICCLNIANVQAANDISTAGLIVVINNAENQQTFTKQQIRHIFMGGALSRKFVAVNLPSGHPLRIQFNTKVIGLTESRIQSYWAQMKFTGRSKPPKEVETTEELLAYLIANKSAMAYLPLDTKLPPELTVIYP